ncbi:MAG: ABC transporter permease [Xanthobacteraceae bacterium]
MKKRIGSMIVPTVAVITFFVLWHYAVTWFQVPSYLLPTPKTVIEAFVDGYSSGRYLPHLLATLTEMVLGYLIGCTIALIMGALVAEWNLLERIVYPFVVALQSVPKVALAPLLIVWFGFGLSSKVVLVALICFFPVFINSTTGFKSSDPNLLRLYRAYKASRKTIFLNVKLPSAAESIFAGLQIAVVLALIGAVVGEFISARAGLGFLIQSSTLNFDVSTMFAAIVSLSIIGVTFTFVLRKLQNLIVHWKDPVDRQVISNH